MIKLENIINELGINNPNIPKIPSGWSDTEDCSIFEPYEEGKIVAYYSAPMEGWDDNNNDTVCIIKTPNNEYIVREDWAYGEGDSHGPFNTYNEAFYEAIDVMNNIKDDWDEDDEDEDEDDEDY